MKNLRTHGKKKIQVAFIIAAFAVIMLFTACKQFLADPEEFLSYWAGESFVEDHNIGSAHRPDDSGVQCVGSSNDADITLSMHNPKNFSFVMPTSSAPAGIVKFKDLSVQPQAGTHYELKQTGSGTLKLTYKKDFLEKYEQGSGSLNPTITLKAKDGRVFQKTYTFGIKSNTPPPAPKDIVIAKTTGTDPRYVLCLKFDPDEMKKMVTIGSNTVPVHKDIANITIKKGSSNNGSSYELLYKGINSGFQKPAETTEMGSFIERGNVQQLTAALPPAQEKWVLYFETKLEVNAGNDQTSYTITLSDNKGVVSDKAVATIKASDPTHEVKFSVVGGTGGTLTAKYGTPTKTVMASTAQRKIIVSHGAQVEFTATPTDPSQYKVGDWTCTHPANFTGTSGSRDATLTVTADTTVTVQFVQLDALTLTKLEIHRKDAQNGSVTLPYSVTKVDQSDITLEFSGHPGIPFTIEPSGGVTLTPDVAKSLTIKVVASPGNYPAWSKTVSITRSKNNVANLKSFKLNGETKTVPFANEYTVASDTAEVKDFTFDTASTGATASVSPQGNVNIPADTGKSFTITVKAQDGTVTQNVIFTVKRQKYNVNYSVAGGNGKIKAGSGTLTTNGNTQVAYNGSVTFTARPDPGWEVDSWKVDGSTVSSQTGTTYTLSNVTGDKTVTVKFKPGELHFNSGGPDAWKRLREEANKPRGAHTIVINGEITATDDEGNHGEITLGRDLTIMGGSGAVLNANERSRVFEVENGKTLTLKDITLKNGKTGQLVGGGGVYIDDGGTLIMQGSSTITNCKAGKGGGVYVKGTFKMEGSARVDQNNEVYLESGKTVTVTGALTHEPAAKIRVADYQKNRVLAVGEHAKKENFKLALDGSGNNWRYKKVGNEVKFVTGKLTVTFDRIKCVRVDDGLGNNDAEYYWTMKVDGAMISERKDGDKHTWKAKAGDTLDINKNAQQSYSYFPVGEIPVDIDLYEDDGGSGGIVGSGDDYIGTTKAKLTYNYDNDAWTWVYAGGNWNKHGNKLKNPNIAIGNGYEEAFTEQYRTNDGDTDLRLEISWRDE